MNIFEKVYEDATKNGIEQGVEKNKIEAAVKLNTGHINNEKSHSGMKLEWLFIAYFRLPVKRSVYISVNVEENGVSCCVSSDELVVTGSKSCIIPELELIEITVAVLLGRDRCGVQIRRIRQTCVR